MGPDRSRLDADIGDIDLDGDALRSLRRIAETLRMPVGAFFGAPRRGDDAMPRSREAQVQALFAAFDRIVDAQEREALIALVEAEAALAAEKGR